MLPGLHLLQQRKYWMKKESNPHLFLEAEEMGVSPKMML